MKDNVSTVTVKESQPQPIKNLMAFIKILVTEEVERAIEKLKTSQNFTKLLEDEVNVKLALSSLNSTEAPKLKKKIKPHQVYYIRRRPENYPPRPFVSGTQEDSLVYSPQKFSKRKIRALSDAVIGNGDGGDILKEVVEPIHNEDGRGPMSSISATASNTRANLKAFSPKPTIFRAKVWMDDVIYLTSFVLSF